MKISVFDLDINVSNFLLYKLHFKPNLVTCLVWEVLILLYNFKIYILVVTKSRSLPKNPLLRLASRTSMRLKGMDVEKQETRCGSQENVSTSQEAGSKSEDKDSSYYPIFLPIDQDFKVNNYFSLE